MDKNEAKSRKGPKKQATLDLSFSRANQSSQASTRPKKRKINDVMSPASRERRSKKTESPSSIERQAFISNFSTNGEISLSEEQEKVLETVMKPFTSDKTGTIVRVTAAAGAGKTTTLLKVAEYASTQMDHSLITYVTFNKTAAADGSQRLEHVLPPRSSLNACTLHSCAYRCLKDEFDEEEATFENRMLDDTKLEKKIKHVCKRQIEDFLQDCYQTIDTKHKFKEKIEASKDRAFKQVLFFLRNTFQHFCHSKFSIDDFSNEGTWGRDYYPAKIFHTLPFGDGPSYGFENYDNRLSFYADTILKVFWPALREKRIQTFDSTMKNAQLKKLEIPGSLLLCDESQDYDACQIDWLTSQIKYGKHVYFVGDAAQTIYSFRGARSKYMAAVQVSCDCKLTKCWRFGPSIARVANLVLFAKENSPQTQTRGAKWIPYRLLGKNAYDGIVTTASTLPDLSEGEKVTIIGRTNASLLVMALRLFGFKFIEKDDEDDESSIVSEECSEGSTDEIAGTSIDPSQFPKIHINGKGEYSGMKKWHQIEKQINELFQLYKCRPEPAKLNPSRFPEFASDDFVTWESFTDAVQSREMTKYSTSISVIYTLKTKTEEALDLFKRFVMKANHTPEESQVILSTCHAAKGMEWDNVYVLEDFQNINSLKTDYTKNNLVKVGFDFNNWGDDVNCLYVAVTRAKRKLYIPSSIHQFLAHCDQMRKCIAESKTVHDIPDECRFLFGFDSKSSPMTKDEAKLFYEKIILKLRTEVEVDDDQTLTDVFMDVNNEECVNEEGTSPYESDEDYSVSHVRIVSQSPTPCDDSSW